MKSMSCVLALLMLAFGSAVHGQDNQVQPQEYIQSTSPLPNGGFVSSVFYPGQNMRGHLDETSLTIPHLAQQIAPGSAPRSISSGVPVMSSPSAIAPVQQNFFPQTVSAWNVPNLGIPAAWDRSIRRGCACQPGTIVQPQMVAPPVATQPTTLTQSGYRTALNPVVTTGANLQLQNMPPNVYVGRGVFGGPSQYIDGQPVRNLFRFISH